ncbi:Adenylyl cyclase-associated protein [Phytophthora palmivora]|uniref:Adenylyl cyclase-associated protein n=1 Tax=Phytophthora palmivora TaxID=4796 RepID=A0A2P4X4D6_9STRA|nr:Adenylyl cyclase-associated protein [Phytophthora palmivora]
MTSKATLQQSLFDDFSVRLARVEAHLGLNAATEGMAPQIDAYDVYVEECLPPFLIACEKLGDHTSQLGGLLQKAFTAQRAFLLLASRCKQPPRITPADFESLTEVQSCVEEISKMRDNRSEFTNHQNMVYEAIQALGWLCVERTPKPAVDSFVDGLDFWGNKIRVQFKTFNPHIDFVVTLKNLLTQLAQYIKIYHLVGVTWNPKGIDVSKYTPAQAMPLTKVDPGRGLANALDDIKSAGMSTGFKMDMPTNRKDVALAKKSANPVKFVKRAVCEERNGNWHIEYHEGYGEPLTVRDISIKQQVYIFGCEGTTILLEGKAKNIVLDSCKKTKLIFDDTVSGIEIVNCKGVQVQCKGVVPFVSIDKTDGCLVYITWEGREVQFVTSKSSEMNVVLPDNADSDNFVEKPIPEQFVHKITADLAISSDVSSLYS